MLENIDKIARDKKRDVVWLDFKVSYNGSSDHPRNPIINWLNQNNIKWEECAEVASETGIRFSYSGSIFIDIPYDLNDLDFKNVLKYLKDQNGNMKPEFDDTLMNILTLETAMQNAHHDEPGFWKKWAEDF